MCPLPLLACTTHNLLADMPGLATDMLHTLSSCIPGLLACAVGWDAWPEAGPKLRKVWRQAAGRVDQG